MTLSGRINLDTEEAKAEVALLDKLALPTARNAMRAVLLLLTAEVIENKLSGQVLKRDTGTLQRSVSASPKVTMNKSPARVTGAFGTALDYGRAHEQGFHGVVTVRGHVRRIKSRTVRAKRKVVAQGVAFVKEHQREVDIPAKWYLRDTLIAGKPMVRERFIKAFRMAIKHKGLPSVGAIATGGT